MQCSRCEIGEAVSICAVCEIKLCADCRITCIKCSKHLCTRHVRLTGSGKRLCSECYEARKKKKRKKKEAQALSFASLEKDLGDVAHTSQEATGPEATGEPAFSDAPGRVDPDEFGFDPDDQAGDKMLEFDAARPLLVASGYQPPTKKWLIAAFILFGFSGLYLFISLPNLRDIMLPFDSRTFEIGRNVEAPMYARNTIRQHGSIAKLNLFFQIPAFVITWGVTLAYLYGLWGFGYGGVRSFINYTLTKAAKKKNEQQV